MSSLKEAVLLGQQGKGLWVEVDVEDSDFLDSPQVSPTTKKSTRLVAVYPIFCVASALLAGFFAVSLFLAFTTQYFIDWPSALVGFLGTAGLAVVGWFSKRQIEK